VQRSDQSIELRVAFLSDGAPDKTDRLRSILQQLVGRNTPVRVMPVDAIHRAPSGKHHVVIRED